MKVKNLIQELIEKGEVDIKNCPRTFENNDMGIYKDPIPDHSKGNNKDK